MKLIILITLIGISATFSIRMKRDASDEFIPVKNDDDSNSSEEVNGDKPQDGGLLAVEPEGSGFEGSGLEIVRATRDAEGSGELISSDPIQVIQEEEGSGAEADSTFFAPEN